MAHLTSAPTTLTIEALVTIHSFGHEYSGTVVELKPRTCKVRYTNKGGKVYTLQVKRTDVAAPTATQKAGTERGVKTRELRGGLRRFRNYLEYLQGQAAETIEQVNASKADGRRVAQQYGWTIRECDADLTPEQFAALQAQRVANVAEYQARVAQLEAELAAHLAAA